MTCDTFEKLRGEVFAFVLEKLKSHQYVVVRMIEETFSPNGQVLEFFDSPTAALGFAREDFYRQYTGKELREIKSKREIPGAINGKRFAANMIVRLLLANDGVDSVKYIIYSMSPAHIAQLLTYDCFRFEDLAVLAGYHTT